MQRDPLTGIPAETFDYVRAVSRTVDSKARYFPGHSDGVAYLTRMVGTQAGLDRKQLARLEMAAMFHDVGKLLVPDEILNAPRKLTPDEWQVIQRHPVWSASMAMADSYMQDLAEVVHCHHEHFDGSGYPRGLAGRDIPWESRVILVCDAFHVMTSTRPYRESLPRGHAFAELRRCAGFQFDPEVVELMVEWREVPIPPRSPGPPEPPHPPFQASPAPSE